MTNETLSQISNEFDTTEIQSSLISKIKKYGWGVFAVQFLALAAWKSFMFFRFSGTFDEAIYQQGIFLISRGHFDPVATIKFLPLIRDHATVLVWLPVNRPYWAKF